MAGRVGRLLSLGSMLVLTLPASAWGQKPVCPADVDTAFAGVAYRLEERARDGKFQVCPDVRTQVDANADLVLTFTPPAIKDSAAATAEQKHLLELLEVLEQLGRDVARLNAKVIDLSDSSAIASFQADVTATTGRVSAAVHALRAAGMTNEEMIAVVTDSVNGGYVGLARWLRDHIAAEQRATAEFIRSRDSVVVQVMAYKDPVNGKRAQLHVQNYDELPLGELRPIDRYGMNLTPAEQERLRTEIEGNQQIARAIDRITTNADTIRREIHATASRIVGHLDSVLQALSAPSQWLSKLADARSALDRLSAEHPTAAVVRSLNTLRSQIDSIRGDLSTVDSTVSQVRRLRSIVTAPSSTDFANLVAGPSGIVSLLGSIQNNLVETPDRLELAQAHLSRASATLATLPATLTAQVTDALNLEGLDSVTQTLKRDLPVTAAALNAIRTVLGLAVGQAIPSADILEDVSKVTFHRLDDLPVAVVELERTGWTLGDRVTVVVRFSQLAKGDGAGPALHETTYRLDARLMGGHREFSSAVIFVRAVNGSAEQRKWKPNVAALVSWHHYFRNPQSSFRRSWNAFDPALGLHLANLDQTEDNIEFGLGVNLTLWHGLLSGGYGYNLSRDTQGTYWFVGLNLFDVLSRSLR